MIPVLGQHVAPGDDLELGTFDLRFEGQVGDALHRGDLVADVLPDGKHPVQVVAEELDGDVGLRTGKHGVDPVRDRLADLHADALDLGETLPHVGHEFRPGTVLEYERRFDLRGVHAQGVFVQLGTAGLAGDGLDFRDGKQDFLHRAAYPVALRQRDPRLGGDVDGQRAFVESGQETAPHPQEEHHPGHEQHTHRGEHPRACVPSPTARHGGNAA